MYETFYSLNLKMSPNVFSIPYLKKDRRLKEISHFLRTQINLSVRMSPVQFQLKGLEKTSGHP